MDTRYTYTYTTSCTTYGKVYKLNSVYSCIINYSHRNLKWIQQVIENIRSLF